jgi:hypothetical protein
VSQLYRCILHPIIPSFAVFAFAKEDNTVRLVVTSSTSSSGFLHVISNAQPENIHSEAHFSSRYSSPKLTSAVSYSRTAASEVTEGGLEMISLYKASAFLGSVFVKPFASSILAEFAGAILICGRWM